MSAIQQVLSSVGASNSYFNENRILIPFQDASNSIHPYLYNWSTNTLTSLTGNSTFYNNGGSGLINVVLSDTGDYYVLGAGSTANPSFSNILIIPSGTTTANYYRYFSGIWTDYGDSYSTPTWNSASNKVQYVCYPNPADSSAGSNSPFLVTVGSTGSASAGSNTSLRGVGQWTGYSLLTSMSSTGSVSTSGSQLIGVGATTTSVNDSVIFYSSSPYTSYSTSTSLSSNTSRSSVSPLSATTAVVVSFGSVYHYTGSGSYTDITVNTQSSASMSCRLVDGVYGIYSQSGNVMKIYSGAPTPTWTTDISTELNLSTRNVLYAWGAGTILYVITQEKSSPYQWYISKLDVNISSGSYTATHRTLTGLNNGYSLSTVCSFQYV